MDRNVHRSALSKGIVAEPASGPLTKLGFVPAAAQRGVHAVVKPDPEFGLIRCRMSYRGSTGHEHSECDQGGDRPPPRQQNCAAPAIISTHARPLRQRNLALCVWKSPRTIRFGASGCASSLWDSATQLSGSTGVGAGDQQRVRQEPSTRMVVAARHQPRDPGRGVCQPPTPPATRIRFPPAPNRRPDAKSCAPATTRFSWAHGWVSSRAGVRRRVRILGAHHRRRRASAVHTTDGNPERSR